MGREAQVRGIATLNQPNLHHLSGSLRQDRRSARSLISSPLRIVLDRSSSLSARPLVELTALVGVGPRWLRPATRIQLALRAGFNAGAERKTMKSALCVGRECRSEERRVGKGWRCGWTARK